MQLHRCQACRVMVAGRPPKKCPACGEAAGFEYVAH